MCNVVAQVASPSCPSKDGESIVPISSAMPANRTAIPNRAIRQSPKRLYVHYWHATTSSSGSAQVVSRDSYRMTTSPRPNTNNARINRVMQTAVRALSESVPGAHSRIYNYYKQGGSSRKASILDIAAFESKHRTDICTVITPSWRATARVTQIEHRWQPRGLGAGVRR